MVFLSFSVFSLFFCVFLCFSTFFYVFSMLFLAFLCFSVFRQYPSSGSFGGQVWGPRCIFFVYSSTTIWALFAKQQGHQIASIITTCTRTDEEPCIPGPLCSCTDTALLGTLLPAGSSDFGGPPLANQCLETTDLVDPRYFSPANVKNRLESYFQMIEQKKAHGETRTAA